MRLLTNDKKLSKRLIMLLMMLLANDKKLSERLTKLLS